MDNNQIINLNTNIHITLPKYNYQKKPITSLK